MSKVYLVTLNYEYDGKSIEKVLSTQMKALDYIRSIKNIKYDEDEDYYYIEDMIGKGIYDIEEFEVQ